MNWRLLSSLKWLRVGSVSALWLLAPTGADARPASTVSASPHVDSGSRVSHLENIDRRNQVGIGVGLEPTLLTELYYGRSDHGLLGPSGLSFLRAGLAPLTGPTGFRLQVERWETVLRTGIQRLVLIAGLRLSGGRDPSAYSTSVGATLGARYGLRFERSEFGVQVLYAPSLLTWLRFSDDYRESFEGRYPDARDTAGPESATLGFAAQRVQAALSYNVNYARLVVWVFAGIQVSPGAGAYWAALELGQVPVLLSTSWGYRF